MFVISTVVTLLFDIPMQEIKSVIMECTDESVKTPSEDVGRVKREESTAVGDGAGARVSKEKLPAQNNSASQLGKRRGESPESWSSEEQEEKRRSLIRRDDAYDDLHTWDYSKGSERRLTKESEYSERRRSSGSRRSADPEDLRRHYQHQMDESYQRDKGLRPKSAERSRESPFKDQRGMGLLHGRQAEPSVDDEDGGPLHTISMTGYGRRKPEEPRVSDEDDWEEELRIRRRKLAEKLQQQDKSSIEEQEEWDSVRRRSSAEGKIALLKEPTDFDSMNNWTVTKGLRVSHLGSSQEPSEAEDDSEYLLRRKKYRDNVVPFRENASQSEDENSYSLSNRRSSLSQPTSLDEEDEPYDAGLTKRQSLQNLTKLSDDEFRWGSARKEQPSDSNNIPTINVPDSTSTTLFKRESIVKSQASEEDPEYLLPERPKLMQQEEEHPFKKAWHLQKSRSEEDGGAGYIVKDPKQYKESDKARDQASTSDPESPSQTFDNNAHSNGKVGDVALITTDEEKDSSPFNFPSEEEHFEQIKERRQSDSDEQHDDF